MPQRPRRIALQVTETQNRHRRPRDSEAQDTQLQRDALGEAGCVKFFEDKISSRKAGRPGLAAALEYLRRGDTLVVWKDPVLVQACAS
jgi:hypothetical protein